MSRRLAALGVTALAAAAGGGCSDPGAATAMDLATPAVLDGSAAPPDLSPLAPGPCAPALTIDPPTPTVNPFGLATFHGGGGTGAYRFALVEGKSGAILNPLSGAYLAGATAGVDDVVELTDVGCAGAARATAKVVPRIEVSPARADVPLLSHFRVEVEGGSGQFDFTLLQAGSGGTLSATGDYAAGGHAGLDSIKVVDRATADSAIADIQVDPDSHLTPRPAVVTLPVGATFQLRIDGGSGLFDAVAAGAAASYQGGLGVIQGLDAGTTTLDLTDRFTGQKTRVRVDVAPAQRMDANRAGDELWAGAAVTAVGAAGRWGALDLDGDGLADAAFGDPEADVSGWNAGAVYLYRGAMGGPAGKPDRVIAGEEREDWFGRAVVAGDFDGDGEIDLAIGAPRADAGSPDSGAVYLYRGVGNGLLSQDPVQVLAGAAAYDYFGWSLAAGDWNGDGRLDLAVGSVYGEDGQAMPRANDQGAVAIFLGYPDGFLTRPDALIYGQVPDGNGAWRGQTSLQLGYSLAAGDVDGDGRADLVAGTISFNATAAGKSPDASRGNDGAVLVFAGLGPSGPSLGGVRATPSRFYAAGDPDPNSNFGRAVAAGDLDGDGKAEVIVGQPWADVPAKGGPMVDSGSVRVFAGGTLPEQPPATYVTASAATVTYPGTGWYNYLGFSLAVGEATGDAVVDLVIGHWIDDVRVPDGGAVRVLAGRKGQLPDAAPARDIGGVQRGERLGQAVAAPGDMDGDGLGDLLGYAGLTTDGDATMIGGLYFLGSAPQALPRPLSRPAVAAGASLGDSSALVDLNNDGFTDLAVGGSLIDPVLPTTPQSGVNAGAVQIYLGSANGIPATPSLTLKQFVGHSDWDELGWQVAAAGDFDGDGLQDLAVVARYEDLTGPFSDPRYDAGGCPADVRYDVGALYVFRGSRGGVPAGEPAFVLFGPQQSYRIDSLAGGVDVNGDGKGDLVIGSWDWRNQGRARVGGFQIVTGRAATPGKTRVICDPALTAFGAESDAQLGVSVAALPDVDGDGCGEVAIGALYEHLDGADYKPYQGTVRVVFGWGGRGCAARPRLVLLRSDDAYAVAGASLAAADLDGDKIPELAVGGWNHVAAGGTPGGAWIVPGAYLRSLAAGAVVIASGDLATPAAQPLVQRGATARLLVEGEVNGELFGQGVALLADLGNGRGGLAVGAPLSRISGPGGSGGVRIYQYLSAVDGLDPAPVAVFGGETARAGARVGEAVTAGRVNGAPALVVSGHLSSAFALDYGTAYVAPVHLP